MKWLLILLAALAALTLTSCDRTEPDVVPGTETPDPDDDITAQFDEEFAAELQRRGYIPDAAHITFADVADILTLNISGMDNITSIKGIEYFKSLVTLDCEWTSVASLDLSRNTALKRLYCGYNGSLTSLNVSKCTALTVLSCFTGNLSSLDVSNNVALEDLECSINNLTSLDVSKNKVLADLRCGSNQITSLDVSNNRALVTLQCGYNPLTSIDVSKNTSLENLECRSNRLTSLDLSNNPGLYSLSCEYNHLTSLDLSNNPGLYSLSCEYNQLTSLDLSDNPVLRYLTCNDNQLISIDICNNAGLERLHCHNNPGNGATFPVTSWFDDTSVPADFTTGSWDYGGNTITISYQKK